MQEMLVIAVSAMLLMWAQIIFFERKKSQLSLKKHINELRASTVLMVASMSLFQIEELISLFEFGGLVRVLEISYFILLIMGNIMFFLAVRKSG